MNDQGPKMSEATLSEQAAACVARAKEFIERHSEYFVAPSSPNLRKNSAEFAAIAEEATSIQEELNFFGNELNIRGGYIGPIIYEISDLFNHLKIILTGEGFYSATRLLYGGEHDQIVNISRSRKLDVQAVLALERKYGKAVRRRNDEPGLQINGQVPVKAKQQTKLYQVLHVIFALREKVGRAGAVDPELGWMLMNLSNEALRTGMDTGHALGRVWEMNEMHAIARAEADRLRLHTHGAQSITLVSNVRSNGNGFSPDRFRLRNAPVAAIQESIAEALKRVGPSIIWTLEKDQNHPSSPVRGGAEGLIPLANIIAGDKQTANLPKPL